MLKSMRIREQHCFSMHRLSLVLLLRGQLHTEAETLQTQRQLALVVLLWVQFRY